MTAPQSIAAAETALRRESLAILRYVKTLRTMARADKIAAETEHSSYWREHHRREYRRRIRAAWFWRSYERMRRQFADDEQTYSEAAE